MHPCVGWDAAAPVCYGKAVIVAEAQKRGRSVAKVACQNDVNANLLSRRMREAGAAAAPGAAAFIPVDIGPDL